MVENVPKRKHAIAITADNDANILIHVGLDTVELDGNGFDAVSYTHLVVHIFA